MSSSRDQGTFSGSEIAIIGMACRVPGARNYEELWQNLERGVECIKFSSEEEVGRFDKSLLGRPDFVPASALPEGVGLFDAEFFGFTPREAEITDPQHRFFLECAWEALEDACCSPETYKGSIGVYAGSGLNTYLYSLVGSPEGREATRKVGEYRMLLGNGKDHLPTWTSYTLNLRGPSVNVNTACSTSLVAVHIAVQSLLNGECDVALAGGVAINAQTQIGYFYREGGIESPDGHCRAFDADAQGTVSGNGVGVVVLKRLADALDDGDRIHAVLRGSAINNDGSYKVGYTAPSVEGQTMVIREGLAVADLDPRTITYVEAHGTGTRLGDPIEIRALTEAFRSQTEERAFCWLGSVKTNIGHLDAAAGVVGLIKTVLAIEHKAIPPSLHFRQPNPEIDFATSPFRVADRLIPWAPQDFPRRAGVSSFGIGGTNAHVILEEAPAPEEPGPSRALQLLVLSARTAGALDQATRNLVSHLDRNPRTNLPDVVFSLQTGRRAFKHRRMLVCRSSDEAIASLSTNDASKVYSQHEEPRYRPVAFMFPGQGAQYVNMARGLYEGEPSFRAEVDRCLELVSPDSGFNLRSVLFPRPQDEEGAARQLESTAIAQVSLFVVEYALARLWIEWGIQPEAMIGHSLGEYVAACLAGVFALEDALKIVVTRGRLMQGLPGGAMLSVHLGEEDLGRYLGPELTLASVNSPSLSVVSGTYAAIEGFEQRLAEDGVKARRLHTSHAFHSQMMEPILGAFREEVARVRLAPPKIPFLSNLTGTWITAGQATDPEYWASHLRSAVRFGAGIVELLLEPNRLLLEVGPGRSLSTLARQNVQKGSSPLILTSLRHPQESYEDHAVILHALGRLWLSGLQPDWAGFYRHESRRSLTLPTYPFEHKRYWIDRSPRSVSPPSPEPEPELITETHPLEVLAAPERASLASSYVEAGSQVEERIIEVWQDMMGIAPIGIHDNFFELGGHSLLLIEVVARLRRELDVDLSMRDAIEHATPAQLAVVVLELKAEGKIAPNLEVLPELIDAPGERHEPFPLTEVQEAYWIGRSGLFDMGQVATHVYAELQVVDLSYERLTLALRRLIEHHEMLRAIVLPDGSQQILAEVPPYRPELIDLHGASQEVVETRLREIRDQLSHQVLPAGRWPLFDIRVARLDDRSFSIHVSLDMLIADAWSIRKLHEEVRRLYVDPEAELPPIGVSFRDYVLADVAFRESETYRRSLEYWQSRLPTLPGPPELPLARDPASLGVPRFVRFEAFLPPDSWERLKARSSRAGIIPSSVLLAIYADLLTAWSKSPRFVLNLTLFHRLPLHPDIYQVIGDFTSLTLLEVDNSTPGTFEQRALRIQDRLWEDLEHRYVSGVRVLRELIRLRGGSGSRMLAPVVFTSTLFMADEGTSERGSRPPTGSGQHDISQTPQVWIDLGVAEQSGYLRFGWDAVEALFPPGLLREMFGAFGARLRRLADDEDVWHQIELGMVPFEQLQLRAAVNGTVGPMPQSTLQSLVSARAARQPSRPAVISSDRTILYGELSSLAKRLGRRLRERGAKCNELVAVVMEKGWEQIVAVLGVLESGAAYLPIDPALPPERLGYLLEQAQVKLALTQTDLSDALDWPEHVQVLPVDEELLSGMSDEPLPPAQGLDDLAYVIFTSGSTGLPKGVMIDHRGAVNTILDVNERFGIGADDRVLALSALNFDLSVYDIFGVLAAGGAIVLPEADSAKEPRRWADLMARESVTVWNSVPALMAMLVDVLAGAGAPPADLRLVLLSGDWIPTSLPSRIHALWPQAQVISLGGATEASIWSILYPIDEVSPSWTSIPYGKPMRNQGFHVLNETLEPAPDWVPGHLYISGIGLAKGYWGDVEKTAVSFITHPVTGERLYRTGDLGRYLPDGNIEFLGREDFQVKIQGYRIELGEIEAALGQHPLLSAAVVTAVGEQRGEKRLVAYVVPAAPPTTAPANESASRYLVAGEVISDPIRRLEFKAQQRGLRRDLAGPEILLVRTAITESSIRDYSGRRSYRRFEAASISLAHLSEWLRALSEIQLDGRPKYRYPSAGSLYPVQAYLYIKEGRVEGIPGGTYYYQPKDHQLLMLVPGARIDSRIFGDENSPVFEQAAFALFLVVDHRAIDPLYGSRARDFALLEAGYMGQLLMGVAPAHELGLCPIGGLEFEVVRPLLALGDDHEFLHGLLGGTVDPLAVAQPSEGDDYQLFLQLLEQESAQRADQGVAQVAGQGELPVARSQVRAYGQDEVFAELRSFLSTKLPEYMIPTTFMILDSLPLTPNGKVDRQALPKPSGGEEVRKASFVEPSTPLEVEMVDLWREVLGVQRLGLYDDFFEAGGHSLLAARLIARVRERFGVELTLGSLFEAPNVAGMVAAVSRQRLHGDGTELPAMGPLPAIVHDPERLYDPFPLTDLQQAYWVGSTGAFALGNLPPQFYLELELSELETNRFQLALQHLIERHDMLRAVVLPDGTQQILPAVPLYHVQVLDWREMPADRLETARRELRDSMSRRVAATAEWPLFEIKLSRPAEDRFHLHLAVSLLICDAWSTSILSRELTRFYQNPKAELPPIGLSFRDYVLAISELDQSAVYQRSLRYWLDRLEKLPPGPELPLVQVPDQSEHPGFTRRSGRLEPEAWQRLRKRATEAGVTPDTALCAAYCEILARWSKAPHFTLNVLYFNRLPLHPDVESILANFSSTILLEVEGSRGSGFQAKARLIQEQLWRDLEHSHVSGVRVLRELNKAQGRAGAVVPVVFASTVGLNPAAEQDPPAEPGRGAGLGTVVESRLHTPQVWLDHQVHLDGGALVFNWDSVELLFPVGFVEEMFQAYVRLLDHLSAPEARWEDSIPLLASEQLAVRAEANATEAPLPERLLHAPLADWAATAPDRPAVISARRTLTYGELYRGSCRLGRQLREAGASPNTLVAVVMEKGWEQVVAVAAVLASGAAYLPIDPELPVERQRYLLRQGEVKLALTQPWLEGSLDWPEGVRQFVVDDREGDGAPLEPIQTLDDLAYVIFTSGSTGLPKGVAIDHLGAANTIADINHRFAVGVQDRILAISSLSFDLSVYDIFGMFAAGGAVVIPDPAAMREPAQWAALVKQERVSLWSSVPALMEMLVDYLADRGEPLPEHLRLVMMSGDWIPVTLPERIRELQENVEIVSLGGATEASIWSIWYPIQEMSPAWKSIPYGKPLRNQRFHVLEEKSLEHCPTWVTGQLYIGGVGLAKGYWRDEEKTAASFIRHPVTGERLYRTGDLGRYLPDGNLEFLGREDLQVKIQGYRIELGEIEAALTRHPAVRVCAAVAVGEEHGSKSLKLYVVTQSQEVTDEELRHFLQERLPSYMVPRTMVFLDELPLSSNGKVDRGALERLDELSADRHAAFVPPRDVVELQLVQIWEQILDLQPIGVHDSFFDLGGHSLLAVRLMSRIQHAFGRDLPLSTLFETGTVARLAALLRDDSASAPRLSALVPIQPRGTKRPFFWVHPIGGNVLCYVDLARQLDPERPFYGLQVIRPEDPRKSLLRIEDMATHYLEEVRKVQAEGPFLLGGWSMGGVVAFEMAQQLHQAGEQVEVLALVDSEVPSNGKGGDVHLDSSHLLAWFAQDLGALAGRDLGLSAGDLQELEPDRQLSIVLDRAKKAGVLLEDMELSQLAEHFRIFEANAQALHRYEPSAYPGRLLLLQAGETAGNGSEDRALSWRDVALGGVDVRLLPGNHYTIVSRPHVNDLAEQLRTLLTPR